MDTVSVKLEGETVELPLTMAALKALARVPTHCPWVDTTMWAMAGRTPMPVLTEAVEIMAALLPLTGRATTVDKLLARVREVPRVGGELIGAASSYYQAWLRLGAGDSEEVKLTEDGPPK